MQQIQLKKLNRISGADFNFVPADNNGGIGVPIEAFYDYFYTKQVQNLTTATKKVHGLAHKKSFVQNALDKVKNFFNR